MLAPEGSVTVPASVAPATWAWAVAKSMGLNTSATNARELRTVFVEQILENMGASKGRLLVIVSRYLGSQDRLKKPTSQSQGIFTSCLLNFVNFDSSCLILMTGGSDVIAF